MRCCDVRRGAGGSQKFTSRNTRSNGECKLPSLLTEGNEDLATSSAPSIPRSDRAPLHPTEGSTDSRELLASHLVFSITEASGISTHALPPVAPNGGGSSMNKAPPLALGSTPTPVLNARRAGIATPASRHHRQLSLRLDTYPADRLLCPIMAPRRLLRVPQ